MNSAATGPRAGPVTRIDDAVHLVGTRCGTCEAVAFPPRSRCPDCGSEALEEVTFDRTASLETFSIIRVPQEGFEAPYGVGFARLSPGDVRVFGPIEGSFDDLAVGRDVDVAMLSPETGPVPEEIWGFTTSQEGRT